ncbi:hypothetical protein HRR83_003320 [Exophiala dermatitidis]|uniref:Integral membrane protein n=2 Tax=Exophiala dermatitidis TaxID=5970 RepID=H6BMT8_EXODN|nr:uncharacterized protein HMPREF1120_00333 [Exophiala dermatitidis NIH/UT8656]KAJ4514772.1 hypothetical protein HRR75_004136 [Exophiala dermatitidis]EHY52116.1 hypothetical protein HMPREF1120_00333 [Exophiala dermatitidis NIH/UT8656]KAJ4518227.1 hypothetical protein HRR74_004522 [Exophiala dermatitidis]KAJ4521125.1 hypothetical protein HRR73_003466 [Exophiala dermatitidis]KAJ4547713.1 hypothetical protein HRR76_000340 [Exophiala dermatitidis]
MFTKTPTALAASPSTIAFLLITFSHLVLAQTIVPTSSSNSFPGCALSCTVLLQAQTLCTPPNVASTNQITYENCFCQSSLLQALYSTPDAICAGECTIEADRQQLQKWFTGFCAQVGQGVDPLTSTAATTSPTSTNAATVTRDSSGAANSGTGSASGSKSSSSHQAWIEGHWRWILMVAILAVGFAFLAWLAVWLKRRHSRKIEERRAAVSGFPTPSEKRDGARSATPDIWGPHQHMHYTKGWEYHDGTELAAGGALAASGEKSDKLAKKMSSSNKDTRQSRVDRSGVPELVVHPVSSTQPSSKGKGRATDRATELDHKVEGEASRSRSRSQRREHQDYDDDIEAKYDSEHQRRLREVRGTRRMDME